YYRSPAATTDHRSFDSSPLPIFLCSSLSLPLYRFVSVSLIGPPFGSLFHQRALVEICYRLSIFSNRFDCFSSSVAELSLVKRDVEVLMHAKTRAFDHYKGWSLYFADDPIHTDGR
ncbi:hypothetical protein HID58_081137, partial [Brassica napus]